MLLFLFHMTYLGNFIEIQTPDFKRVCLGGAVWRSFAFEANRKRHETSLEAEKYHTIVPQTERTMERHWEPTLPQTNSSPLKIGQNAPKGKDHLPTIDFQGQAAVSFREDIYIYISLLKP